MPYKLSGNEIRQQFIEFFQERGHTFVPSSSLVPGGDQTLLFTNAGMVQFKDVFLGTDRRSYTRAVNSQKCMRVAGKHNDLDDVGRDDIHHTFFEMLGNWSFGDYYKAEAIQWAWQLLTEKWQLDKDKLWVTYFKDEKGEIPTDDEAAEHWSKQPGLDPSHILFFGRKDNYWEMADVGPSGPCSEIHIDRGTDFCQKKEISGHQCKVNGDCGRFLELWNLVFIQYNRISPTELKPLPQKHVDTGMGFERIVSILQNVNSNYKTDLLQPLMDEIMDLTGTNEVEREKNLTPYRVIADHSRAAAFLVADGVVPGNMGRNYICRMIIRRAFRFGIKLGLTEPFIAKVAQIVIDIYGDACPELKRNAKAILGDITREEERFQATLNTGLSYLDDVIKDLKKKKRKTINGLIAFDLYSTHGLPLEITKDLADENKLSVDEKEFQDAMEKHRMESGAGKAFGSLGGEDAEFYGKVFQDLVAKQKLPVSGVMYDPYVNTTMEQEIVAILRGGEMVDAAQKGEEIEIITKATNFYLDAGGQVSDTGYITSVKSADSQFELTDVLKPAAGLIIHKGQLNRGMMKIGDQVILEVDRKRRLDIMRNHTATHLLHAALRKVLGNHVRQAGSLVAPERLRFDFTHPQALSKEQIKKIEDVVNNAVLSNYDLKIAEKPLQEAIDEGAMALFGEKYDAHVRTVNIGDDSFSSYELCGGTHVDETGQIGIFLITSEGSVAAGIRRIEAITGRYGYQHIQKMKKSLNDLSILLGTSPSSLNQALLHLIEENEDLAKKLTQVSIREKIDLYEQAKKNIEEYQGLSILVLNVGRAEADELRSLADKFRSEYSTGAAVFGGITSQDQPVLIVTVTKDLIKKGVQASIVAKLAASEIGGSGGGRPDLAQAGGKNPSKLEQALQKAKREIKNMI